MNQRRNGLSNVNGKSESVKEKERMIWSEVGMLVGTLSLLDIIVRGLVLTKSKYFSDGRYRIPQ